MNESGEIKSQVVSSLIWKFLERISAQLVSTVVSIILARLLMPEDYGVITMVLVFINIANSFVTGGFGNALIRMKDAQQLEFSTLFFCNIGLSVVLYLILFITAPYLAVFYNAPELTLVFRILGIRVIVAAINSIQHAYVAKHMLFKKFFFSTLFGTIVSGVVGVLAAFHGAGCWALVAQYLTNTIIDTIVLFFTVQWRPTLAFSFNVAKKLSGYSIQILAASVVNSVYEELRSLIIGKVYSSADLAYYNKGEQFPKLAVNNINASIESVFFPALSQKSDNIQAMKSMVRRSMRTSCYIMFPIMMGLAVVSKPFVQIVLTDKWLFCVPYMQLACFRFAWQPAQSANAQVVKALGRGDLYLKLEMSKKILNVVLLVLVLRRGVMAIAIMAALSGVTGFLINASPNKSLLNYTYREQLLDMLPEMLAASAMAIICIVVGSFLNNPLLKLLVQIAIGVVSYVAISVIFKMDSFEYIVGILKKRVVMKKGEAK